MIIPSEDNEDEVQEILRLGRENPLSRPEALGLLVAIIKKLQERDPIPQGLDGDPEVIADRIISKRERKS